MAVKRGKKEHGIKRRLKWDEYGVASTVATVMILMVFVVFMNTFIANTVPTMMKEKEADHMKDVETDFYKLKAVHDILALSGNQDLRVYSPIRMGSEGVPIYAPPTPGTLKVDPNATSVEAEFWVGSDLVHEEATGAISLECKNRYFVEQTYFYENGAVLMAEERQELVKVSPTFNVVVNTSGTITVEMMLFSLVAQSETIAGAGAGGVTSVLAFTDTQESIFSSGTALFINITTDHTTAWESWYDEELADSGVTYSTNTVGNTVTVTVQNVDILVLTHAYIEVELGGY